MKPVRSFFVLAGLAVAAALAYAKPQGANVHHPAAPCNACHTADETALRADPEAARRALAPDLEARCIACHGDQGPSHQTGIPPRPPAPDLPLSEDGRITCATCHFVHGESNTFGDFVRLDNRRGALCLTCHELSELEK